MAYDTCIGILLSQLPEQGEHRSLLSLSPGIGRTTFLIETAFVANAEGTVVVMPSMSPTDILGENGDDGTVATDVVVIGGLAEAGIARGDKGFDRERTVTVRGAAVNNEQLDCGML